MTHMLVRHKVVDFDRWARVFDSHAEAQRRAGLILRHLWRNIDEPGEVLFLFEAADVEAARRFVSSPEVPGAKEESGVADEPDIWFLEPGRRGGP